MLATITILSLSGTVDNTFAQTISLIPTDSIEDSDNTSYKLNGAYGIVSFTIGSSTYVAVTASDERGVQIIDVTNPSSITATDALRVTTLDTPRDITTFTIGVKTYVAVVGVHSDNVQILEISSQGAITARGSIDDTDSTHELDGPSGITSFKIGTNTFVAVASSADNGVQIINVTNPANITATASIDDSVSTDYELERATQITSFKIGAKTFVAVTGTIDDGVQILEISSQGAITARGSIDNADGALELDGADGITSFKIGAKTFVAVVGFADDGVQILEISSQGAITARGSIDNADGALELDGPSGITSFKIGAKTFVAVTSVNDDGVQILEISSQGAITAIDSIDDIDGALELDEPRGVTSFKIDTSTYLAVSGNVDDGVQILKLNQPPTANAGSNQSVAFGATVTLSGSGSDPDGDTLSYSWAKPAGSSVMLSSTTAQNPTFTAPSSVGTIIFTLTVSDSTLSATDTVTITVSAIPNQPPTANAGADKTATPGSTVTLSGSGTDPDGDDNNLKYTWKQNPTDAVTVELTDENSARTTFTAPADPTELVFTLTVSDGPDSTTDDITITIKERPVQIRNIKEIDDTIISSQITAPNQITMIYNEQLSTFINSYLNFTISGEDMPRNIIGIDGSPSKSMVVNIDGNDTNAFVTTLTFDGEAVPAGSTGTMYMQHTDYYLKFMQVSDGQD